MFWSYTIQSGTRASFDKVTKRHNVILELLHYYSPDIIIILAQWSHELFEWYAVIFKSIIFHFSKYDYFSKTSPIELRTHIYWCTNMSDFMLCLCYLFHIFTLVFMNWCMLVCEYVTVVFIVTIVVIIIT